MVLKEKPAASRVDEFMEDYALAPVPREKRRGWLTLFVEWIGFTAVIGCMYTGVALGANVPFAEAVRALIIGNILLVVMMTLTAYIGAKSGLSTTPLLRFTAGRFGAALFSLVVAIPSVGWFGMQCGMFGQAWNAVFPAIPSRLLALIGGLLMMTTAVVGYRGLAFLSKVAAVPLFVWVIGGFVLTLREIGGWSTLYSYAPAGSAIPTFGAAISTVFGSWAVGSAIMADLGRYAPEPRPWLLFGIILVGMFFGHFLLPVAGIAFALWLQTFDFGVIVSHVGMLALNSVVLGAVVVSLAQWTTNDNNLYSAGLAFNNAIPWVKWKMTLLLGVIGAVAGALGITDYFTSYLTFLGQVIPPMGGLLVADYLLLPYLGIQRGFNPTTTPYSTLPPVRWHSIVSWLVGVLTGLYSPGVAALNGIVATVVAHCLICLALERRIGAA
ncbi:MAG: cytosine permease [Bacillota bacterium]|nr:cytosine permease [Bacillota bacterium]MDI7248529.1 cytosine permease [Bacillota bacterium]